MHDKDSDCTVDPETNLCTVCGVEFGEPCLDCGGRGFHTLKCNAALQWYDVISFQRACQMGADFQRTRRFYDLLPTIELSGRILGAWEANDKDHFIMYRAVLAHRTGKLDNWRVGRDLR